MNPYRIASTQIDSRVSKQFVKSVSITSPNRCMSRHITLSWHNRYSKILRFQMDWSMHFKMLCLLEDSSCSLNISNQSPLWGSFTVRMLPLKVTSKHRQQGSLLGLGTELWIWLEYCVVSFLSAAIQCVKLMCVCVLFMKGAETKALWLKCTVNITVLSEVQCTKDGTSVNRHILGHVLRCRPLPRV